MGQIGDGHPARRLDVALSLTAGAAARLHRPPEGKGRRESHRDDRRARIHPGPLVAAAPAQSDGAAGQGTTPLPEERRRHRRPLSSEALAPGRPGPPSERSVRRNHAPILIHLNPA